MAPRTRPTSDLSDVLRFALASAVRPAARRIVRALWARPVSGAPTKLLFAPLSFQRGDPENAAEIYAGIFVLAGERLNAAGHSPFTLEAPSERFARALHSFGWLSDLAAAGGALSATNARALFDEWLSSAPPRSALRPGIVAERLSAWLAYSDLLLSGADGAFRQRFLRAIGRQMRRLEAALVDLPTGIERLQAAAALALAGTVSADQSRALRLGLAALDDEIKAQILSDGGHVSRAPAALASVLEALLPLRAALAQRDMPLPTWLTGGIERIFPLLGFFDDGSGGLVDWHGGGGVGEERVAALRAADDVQGRSSDNLRDSGFQRLSAGASVVLFDTGKVPPLRHARRCHAATLGFTLRDDADPVVLGCGALGTVRSAWREPARNTAAQSTLVLSEASSARFVRHWPLRPFTGPVAFAGPHTVGVERGERSVRAVHDGYVSRFGVKHERQLSLSKDGLALRGIDRLRGQDRLAALAFAVRFHLAPDVRVRLDRRRRRALMSLPSGAVWMFKVDDGPEIAVEDSVVLWQGRAWRTGQLVLSGNTLTHAELRWQFARQSAPQESERPAAAPDEDA